MFSRLRIESLVCVSAVAASLCVGCAKVKVRKVPTPTQYTRWSDDMQEQADKMEGFRFYLPRPFIQVRQSFPIRTETYLVHGKASADGRYVIVGAVEANSGLAKYVATGANRALIPAQHIQDPSKPSSTAIRQQNDEVKKATKEKNDAERRTMEDSIETGVVGKPAQAPQQPQKTIATPPPVEPPTLTGINKKNTTNDNGAAAVQFLRGANFDVVYMPDFEEQFVVSSKAGLGNAEFELNLGQGWSLQGFNSISDNSELNKRIFDLIDRSMELVDTAATAKVDDFVAGLNPGDSATLPRAQSESTGQGDDKAVVRPSQDVTLKVTVVYYAAKGLYPVMKPREMQERVTGQETTYYSIDLFKLNPNVTGISEFDPSALARAQVAVANESTDYTVPKYPYQFISFNTFNYMAIEVVENSQTSGNPFKTLYPDRGTSIDAGADSPDTSTSNIPARRTNDPLAEKLDDAGKRPDSISESEAKTFEAEFKKEVAGQLKTKEEKTWDVSAVIDINQKEVVVSADLNNVSTVKDFEKRQPDFQTLINKILKRDNIALPVVFKKPTRVTSRP